MPLPAILAGIGAVLSNPTVLSVIGGILPSVVSALTGSPTEAEAKAKVAPKREEMVAALVKSGLDQATAEQHADEALASEVQNLQASGGLPPWVEGALSVGGAIAGHKVGNWLKGAKGAIPAAGGIAGAPSAGTVKEAAAAQGGTVTPSGPTKLTSPFAVGDSYRRENVGVRGQAREEEMARGMRGELDSVGAPRLPAVRQTPPTFDRGFTMPPPDGGAMPMSQAEIDMYDQMQAVRRSPFAPQRRERTLGLGMTPETGQRLDSNRMRSSLYGREGD